jgi:hypothetical protein
MFLSHASLQQNARIGPVSVSLTSFSSAECQDRASIYFFHMLLFSRMPGQGHYLFLSHASLQQNASIRPVSVSLTCFSSAECQHKASICFSHMLLFSRMPGQGQYLFLSHASFQQNASIRPVYVSLTCFFSVECQDRSSICFSHVLLFSTIPGRGQYMFLSHASLQHSARMGPVSLSLTYFPCSPFIINNPTLKNEGLAFNI